MVVLCLGGKLAAKWTLVKPSLLVAFTSNPASSRYTNASCWPKSMNTHLVWIFCFHTWLWQFVLYLSLLLYVAECCHNSPSLLPASTLECLSSSANSNKPTHHLRRLHAESLSNRVDWTGWCQPQLYEYIAKLDPNYNCIDPKLIRMIGRE